MRYVRPLALLATCCALLGAAPAAQAATETRSLMPVPASVSWKAGALAVDGRFAIGLAGPDDNGRVQRAASRLGAWLQREARLSKVPRVTRGAGTLSVSWKSAKTPVQVLGVLVRHILAHAAYGSGQVLRRGLAAFGTIRLEFPQVSGDEPLRRSSGTTWLARL